MRHLSRELTVSAMTVTRALEILKKEDQVKSVWGKGFFKSQHLSMIDPEKDKLLFEKRSKPRQVVDKFKQDILSGKYRINLPVPPLNQLAAIYEVSYPTIRKAVKELVAQRILKRNGNRYFFFTNKKVQKKRVAVIALGFSRDAIKIDSEREVNFYRVLSTESADRALDLEIISYNDYLERPEFFTPDGSTLENYLKNSSICGLILSSYHMKNSAGCLAKLICTKIPVSIWIEDRKVLQSMERYGTHYKRLAFFDSSYSPLPGRDVGQFLIDKGHKELAYISPFNGSPWSQSRLDGLRKAVCTQGGKVHAFTLTDYQNDYEFLEVIFESIESGKSSFELFSGKTLHPFMSGRLHGVIDQYQKLLRDDLIFSACIPLIEKAEMNKSITAWVCANDQVACLIMDYWNHKGVPLKKRPSLIGFDNTFASFERRISSYEFNTRGEVQSMLNHLLYPAQSLFSGNRTSISLRGSVVERRSTM